MGSVFFVLLSSLTPLGSWSLYHPTIIIALLQKHAHPPQNGKKKLVIASLSLSLAVHKCWGFGQERGDYPQIRGGKKNWISVLPPYSPPFPQNHKNLFPCNQMLTSLLGVRSSLFSSCPLPLLRSPLLPSRCSPPPPRCNASTLRMQAALNCLTFPLAVCFC